MAEWNGRVAAARQRRRPHSPRRIVDRSEPPDAACSERPRSEDRRRRLRTGARATGVVLRQALRPRARRIAVRARRRLGAARGQGESARLFHAPDLERELFRSRDLCESVA